MENVAHLSLPAQSLETAQGRAKEALETALKQVGMIPNMYAGMANAPGLLKTYLFGYNLCFSRSVGSTSATIAWLPTA
ncbi:hypothetical protein AEMCBJ_34010 (plasmid) [Cupriavidus necator]|uniref:hypothetical protein n=1 Tax=Cupriavidus necator TaxID=106590 RepID=UPI003F737877